MIKINIKQLFCKSELSLINGLTTQRDAYEARIKELSADINVLKDKLSTFKCDHTDCNNKITKLTHEKNFLAEQFENNPLKEQLNGNYPKALVQYPGRSLPFSSEKCNVPVNLLITPNDQVIIDDLKKWGLYQAGEDYETLIPKIYREINRRYYKYQYDKVTWGSEEVWEFPFESRYKYSQGIDCDSWSHILVSYYISSGVPNYLIRTVCGDTDLGGHSTVYVYSKKTTKWHHLNSTYGSVLFDEISKYPTHKDAEEGRDKIGIKDVWLSFNNEFSWTTFNTGARIDKLIIGDNHDVGKVSGPESVSVQDTQRVGERRVRQKRIKTIGGKDFENIKLVVEGKNNRI